MSYLIDFLFIGVPVISCLIIHRFGLPFMRFDWYGGYCWEARLNIDRAWMSNLLVFAICYAGARVGAWLGIIL